MIHALRCDKKTFKNIEFSEGMNVILAERTKESTKKDSRNGLGKTTFIEIIDFCLGSNIAKNSTLVKPNVFDWTFSLDFDINGKRIIASRNTSDPRRIFIEGDTENPIIEPTVDLLSSKKYFSQTNWNIVLGYLMFGLSGEKEKFAPDFRSLIPFFIRRGVDAYSTPFEHFRKQHEWDKQVNTLFLLGLGWDFAAAWQEIKDKEKLLQNLKTAAKEGLVNGVIGSIGELEVKKYRLEIILQDLRAQLESFKILPEYKQIEKEANELTELIHNLANENVYDSSMIDYYKSSYKDEKPAAEEKVSQMYYEIGIVLPENVKKRLDEVLVFHEKITKNRQLFVQMEIDRIQKQISQRQVQLENSTKTRSELMRILDSHGALEEYSRLQERYSRMVSENESIISQIESVRNFEKGKSVLKIEKENLILDAKRDYDERNAIREEAILLFNKNSEALYEVPGKLIIDVVPNGYKFDIEIERSSSTGFGYMKVFCYDLMLAQLWSKKSFSPGFLIHDSTVFADVDERQVANALCLAQNSSSENRFQYICCMNSDKIPEKDLPKDFNFAQYVRVTLTDATPDGGLLGIRF